MTVIYLSDLDLNGSGYTNIATRLCTELANRGYDVQAIGFGYNGQEHHYPFRITNLPGLQFLPMMISQLQGQGLKIDCIVVALDILLQEKILQQLKHPDNPALNTIPYIGLFPIEAGPLTQSWALALLQMDARLIMSRFGVEEAKQAGVEAEFISIGVDCDAWRPPTPEERQQLRQGLGFGENTFVVLTVADNQERKNLSRSMEIFADAFKDKDAHYIMVTRPDSPVGWRIPDYAISLGIYSQMSIYKRGIPHKELWALFAAADCFMLTSKAEGLAMPVLEAMAMRLPVLGTDCTAIREHLQDGRGWLINADYVHVDPWGNSYRYLASRDNGSYKLECIQALGDNPKLLDAAQAYTQARTWQEAADTLQSAIKRVTNGKA